MPKPPRPALALLLVAAIFSPLVRADPPPPAVEWPMAQLRQTPRSEPAAGFQAEGVEAVWFDALPWRGKPTRVFAWVGMPKVEPGKKVPGIVLVHGGGGTAFDAWVRLWTGRGYAAIAMDTTGTVPRGTYAKWERHDAGGPPGNDFAAADQPVADQWPYHAVADVVLAHSLLRSRPEVDPDRIGLTGISWGGFLACLVSGVDDRLRFVAPVYGCGFLGENSVWKPELDKLGATGRRWVDLWDPRHYVGRGTMPRLFVSGTNDFAYPLDSLEKTVEACAGPTRQTIRPNMPHGHNGPGENPEEIRAFANATVNGGPPLPTCVMLLRDGVSLSGVIDHAARVHKAEVVSPADPALWANGKWTAAEARLGPPDAERRTFTATESSGTYFLNVIDDRGAVFTVHVNLKPAPDHSTVP